MSKYCPNCKMYVSESFDVCPCCESELIIQELDKPIISTHKPIQQQKQPLTLSVGKIWGLVVICILAIFLMIKGFSWLNGNDKSDTYVCSSCHKTFTNRTDTKSIAYTSMCEPCYEDYKFKQELQEEIEKYQERN